MAPSARKSAQKTATPRARRTPPVPKLKIFIASTVYNFEDHLRVVCGLLTSLGYEVWNSHLGTVPVSPALSNRENCMVAVNACDLFLGIIRPFYGSGVIGPRSITHDECLEAIQNLKPRWFMVHRDVVFARQLLKPYMFTETGAANPLFAFRKTTVMDDQRVIDMYNAALQTEIPVDDRRGHWVQEFYRQPDLLEYVNSQFTDIARVRTICEEMGAR
jgi:hypothetical protein